ncbi:hypothetical protein BU25DRAFT_416372 [Macroventuria anomochaeta]|uniref:Uncharacterized protein n=1 Tax=Macroventuria anomochaeta TaxID=301207 RepID=A0ACB6RH02_9PLEO|nr:uncharacterized protein BU25DRAFT_416372 [Macroventuria anomochaeta]KAF2621123.1 hypothetical protein BU25DRAFT_416372 [Macroventuria anomochaeta]
MATTRGGEAWHPLKRETLLQQPCMAYVVYSSTPKASPPFQQDLQATTFCAQTLEVQLFMPQTNHHGCCTTITTVMSPEHQDTVIDGSMHASAQCTRQLSARVGSMHAITITHIFPQHHNSTKSCLFLMRLKQHVQLHLANRPATKNSLIRWGSCGSCCCAMIEALLWVIFHNTLDIS